MSKFKAGDKVKIISCDKEYYWYADKIGEIYTIVEYIFDTRCYSVEESKMSICENDLELELALTNDLKNILKNDLKNILKNGVRVKCRNGEMFTLIDGVFVRPSPKNYTMSWLCAINEFLEYHTTGDEWSIVEIYDRPDSVIYYFAYDRRPTELLWKRGEKSPQQLELEKLQEQAQNLADRIKMLQESTE